MAEVQRAARPLSPHLQVYRPQITMVSSILIRITGLGLMAGVVLAVWWLLAAAVGPQYFATVDAVATSWFGDLVFTGALWAVWYHYLGGLRHLLWDARRGMAIETVRLLGMGCIVGSVVLTALTLIIINL